MHHRRATQETGELARHHPHSKKVGQVDEARVPTMSSFFLVFHFMYFLSSYPDSSIIAAASDSRKGALCGILRYVLSDSFLPEVFR